MIGHYLLTLGKRRENRILQEPMRPGPFERGWGPCVVGVACRVHNGMLVEGTGTITEWGVAFWNVMETYDALCGRFGTERVNAAIRNRILSNRTWRVLSSQPGYIREHGQQGPRPPAEAPEPPESVPEASVTVRPSGGREGTSN